MAAGTWDLRLREETPGHILDALTLFGWVVITPTWLPNNSVSVSEMFDMAVYSGPKMAHSGRRNRLSGYGNAFMLGTANRLGAVWDMYTSPLTDTFKNQIYEFVLFESGTSNNGVVEGVIQSGGSSKEVVYNVVIDSALDMLRHVCERWEYEWRINPDRSLDARARSDLWSSDPVAIVTPNTNGRQGDYAGWAAKIVVEEDVEEYFNGLSGRSEDGTLSLTYDLSALDDKYAPNGVKIDRVLNMTDGNVPDATALNEVMQARITNYEKQIRRSVDVVLLDAHAPRVDLECGDCIGVFDPEQGLWDNTNPLNSWRGEHIFPLNMRVHEMRWPFEAGMGAQFIDSTSNNTRYDITPYVVPEEAPTRLVVGAPSRAFRPESFRVGSITR